MLPFSDGLSWGGVCDAVAEQYVTDPSPSVPVLLGSMASTSRLNTPPGREDFLQALLPDSQVRGRCLGPATGAGNEMCQWVLKANGQVVSHRIVRPLLPEELHQELAQKKRDLL